MRIISNTPEGADSQNVSTFTNRRWSLLQCEILWWVGKGHIVVFCCYLFNCTL